MKSPGWSQCWPGLVRSWITQIGSACWVTTSLQLLNISPFHHSKGIGILSGQSQSSNWYFLHLLSSQLQTNFLDQTPGTLGGRMNSEMERAFGSYCANYSGHLSMPSSNMSFDRVANQVFQIQVYPLKASQNPSWSRSLWGQTILTCPLSVWELEVSEFTG